MNFTEAVAEVVSITKRPDKILDIRREINAALLFCAVDNVNFAEDLVELAVPTDATLYTQVLAMSEFPRFREFYYVRQGDKTFLTKITPQNMFKCDSERNAYYRTGTNLNIRTAALAAQLQVGFFAYPPVLTDVAPDYWLLEESPYMIIDKAAAKIFTNIGDDTSGTRHELNFRTVWQSFRESRGIKES